MMSAATPPRASLGPTLTEEQACEIFAQGADVQATLMSIFFTLKHTDTIRARRPTTP